ncbi:hypothetical protein WD019_19070 [Fictibacillus sp. Mic-4]|uniref:hypothetical protein n=1 Tax=Fictibacillus TaxID=1329200 RepID=UPI00041C370E|nr:hypothetical protein [Fictibacillus gelatini]HAJ3957190.1 hypothetical protein [Escherichia coli]
MSDEKKKIKRLYFIIGVLAIALVGAVAFVVGERSAQKETPTKEVIAEGEKKQETPQEKISENDVKAAEKKALQVYKFFNKGKEINSKQLDRFVKAFMTDDFLKNSYKKLKSDLELDFESGTTLRGLTGSEYINDPTQGWLKDIKIKQSLIDETTGTIKVFAISNDNFSHEKRTYWTEWIKEKGEWKLYTTDFFETTVPPKSKKKFNQEG